MSSSPIPKPVSNRTRKKSKTGCKTCKLRRVKCDEAHPVCDNCAVYFSNRIESCEYEIPRIQNTSSKKNPITKETSSVVQKAIFPKEVDRRAILGTLIQRDRFGTLFTTVDSSLDPFETLPQTKLPAADKLLHHYLSMVIVRCHPQGNSEPELNPLVEGWWPLVKSDPILFHAELLATALDLESLRGSPNTFFAEVYSRECLRLLRDRVQDPVSGICDQTISSVAVLAALEHARRNMLGMKMHMDGLKKMVRIRGGLQNVRASSPAAANAIFWLTMAITGEPQFPAAEIPDYNEEFRWLFDNAEPDPNLNLIDFEVSGVDRAFSDIMLEIRHLSRSFSIPTKKALLSAKDALSIHSRVFMILQRLLQLPSVEEVGTTTAKLSECCRFAGAIYVFLPFENPWPDPKPMINSLLHKLKSALSSLELCSGDSNELIAWFLSVGGVAAYGFPERDWFVGHLVVVVSDLRLATWEDMKNCLKRIIWMDVCEKPFRLLWDEAMLCAEILTMPTYLVVDTSRRLEITQNEA